jgi:hypothetical protein
MVNQDLEFRGISLSYLGKYFEELGCTQITSSFPLIYKNSGWSAEIQNEEELSLTSIIKVNKIHIRFTADNEEILKSVIKNYRYKTTRIGG